MGKKKGSFPRRSSVEPQAVVKERLNGTNTDLTSFHYGTNVYVFSYEKEGVRRHTFIDTGDSRYRNQILPALAKNDINTANIERIILTHRHPDHCALVTLLAKESRAKILVHRNFKNLVEGEIGEMERGWVDRWWGFDPSQFKELDFEYLPQSDRSKFISINGVDFPTLGEPIEIGEGAKLEILACPESTPTHSPDQIIILYSPKSCPQTHEKTVGNSRPTDDMLFSGDIWLMTGPLSGGGSSDIFRHFRFSLFRVKKQLKNLMSGRGMLRRDPREQDSEAKEALKTGFSLIRVKPGHGGEFIGSRIIPRSLLADRDLLLKSGYSLDADKSLLRRRDLSPKIAALKEQSYTHFIEELLFWRELGYTSDEISELLVRIYKEQIGGGKLVQKDRKQRRERLKATLARLKDDEAEPEELHQLAQSTLLKLQTVL
ncbi:MBL fold metallo-hydrolase [Chloroflexota bacterium]